MAYLHIGMNVMVEDRRVIGIFDLDNTSTSKNERVFTGSRAGGRGTECLRGHTAVLRGV